MEWLEVANTSHKVKMKHLLHIKLSWLHLVLTFLNRKSWNETETLDGSWYGDFFVMWGWIYIRLFGFELSIGW